MATKTKTDKPYPGFPLFMTTSGQWAKKINGHRYYFGTEAGAALKKFLDQRDALYAGRGQSADRLTVKDLCNRFLTAKNLLTESGELSVRTWHDYHNTCARLSQLVGKNREVEKLAGEDFARLRARLARKLGPVALGNEIQRIRTVFKFAFDEGLIEKPVMFGTSFRRPSKKHLRAAKQAAGSKMLEAHEVRRLIDAAKSPVKAMLLLGINCAFGQTDVASLPTSAVDLAGGWVSFPRPKTAMPRRCKLWPETVAALREAIDKRPAAKVATDAGLVFVTKYGYRWVRQITRAGDDGKSRVVPLDAVSHEFAKLMHAAKVKRPGLGFYALRHTHRTIADGSRDQRAADYIMGHVSEHISAHYVEQIEDERIEAITTRVRTWLWPKPAAKTRSRKKAAGVRSTAKSRPDCRRVSNNV